ncbi:MAG: AAA family ATPase [Eubacteriales bacterium]|nr:AAA family ATPase [Eubacteriales bacterium]
MDLSQISNFRKETSALYLYSRQDIKSMMIKDFLMMRDKVALIARPRRFGKTLNMTMLRDFFDITRDSRALFQGLAIMDT